MRYERHCTRRAGHLGDWLNQHRNLPVQDQERLLRAEPSFNRLAPDEQQRLVQQLHQVDQLPEEQRRAPAGAQRDMERLSPQERMQVTSPRGAGRTAAGSPGQMKSAFRDLRTVPPDQRATVLNSARYQDVFSPEERGILSDMLRVEPYEPAQCRPQTGLLSSFSCVMLSIAGCRRSSRISREDAPT